MAKNHNINTHLAQAFGRLRGGELALMQESPIKIRSSRRAFNRYCADRTPEFLRVNPCDPDCFSKKFDNFISLKMRGGRW